MVSAGAALRAFRCAAVCCLFFAAPSSAAADPDAPHASRGRAFEHGERLTYSISWSNMVKAGTAVMEVVRERSADGRDVYRFVSSASSAGMVERFYRVRDRIESVVDARDLSSLSFVLHQSHGKRKRHRELLFDRQTGRVTSIVDGRQEVLEAAVQAQDALSSLYYLRTRDVFSPETPIVMNIFDTGKIWAVEVHTIGRERLRTGLGEFATIKVKTYPKYEGVFMHKGEIFIWLTDDERKLPVQMQSKISIGSVMATLTEIRSGEKTQ